MNEVTTLFLRLLRSCPSSSPAAKAPSPLNSPVISKGWILVLVENNGVFLSLEAFKLLVYKQN